jgi:hypothetical protein
MSDHEEIHEKAQQLILDEMFLTERVGHIVRPHHGPSFPFWLVTCVKCYLETAIYFQPDSLGVFGYSRLRGYCQGFPAGGSVPASVSLSEDTPPVDPNNFFFEWTAGIK